MTEAATALMPAALAAGFVGGCAAIHALRRHADRTTAVLVTVALGLGACLALTMASGQPAASTAAATADVVDPPACYGFE